MECSVCGRRMTSKDGGVTLIGISISINKYVYDNRDASEIYPELFVGKDSVDYNVCYVCWLRSLGVKV